MSGLFELAAFADRNGDDRLSLDELRSYTELVASAMQSQLWIALRDRGFNLLPFLDANGDAQLSYVELSQAHVLGDDERASALPRQYEITFGSAPVRSWGGMMIPSSKRRPQATQGDRASGPRWFAALDRNEDAVVTPREFRGPPAAFRLLDANGDGVVSAHEAVNTPADDRQTRQLTNQLDKHGAP